MIALLRLLTRVPGQDPRNIIDSADLKLVLGSVDKHPANPILTEDKAWELRFDNFQPSVWVDPVDQKWKLWCAFSFNVFSASTS